MVNTEFTNEILAFPSDHIFNKQRLPKKPPRTPGQWANFYARNCGYEVMHLPPRTESGFADWPDALPLDTPPSMGTRVNVDETWSGESIGVITGSASAGLVDIVLACPEALALAPLFLPKTLAIHGHDGSPRRHCWFMDYPIPPTGTFKDLDDNTLIEIRADGCCTLLPPSELDSGETLTWQLEYPVTSLPRWNSETLEAATKTLAACSLLARSWPSPELRHDCAVAAAGSLVRLGKSRDFAEHFVASAARAAGDQKASLYPDVIRSVAFVAACNAPVPNYDELAKIIGRGQVVNVLAWLCSNHLTVRPSMDGGTLVPVMQNRGVEFFDNAPVGEVAGSQLQ